MLAWKLLKLIAYLSSSSNSEVSNDSTCLKSFLETVKTLKSQYDQLHKDFKKSELIVIAYKTGLESVDEKLEVYKANESIYSQDIKVLKFEIEYNDIAIRELRKKLEIAQKEKDGIQFNVNKFENASESLDKLIDSQIVDNCKKEEFTSEPVVIKPVVIKPAVKNSEAKASEAKPKAVMKNNGALIIKDLGVRYFDHFQVDCNYQRVIKPVWNNAKRRVNTVKDKNANTVRPKVVVNAARPKAVVNAIKGNNVNAIKALACWVWKLNSKVLDHVSKHNSASITLNKFNYVDAQGKSKHMTGNMSYLIDYEEIDEGYVAFRGNPKGGKITGK
ncbi:hypothetical protein Tco_0579084, partial [Tanacetum coccineum]